MLTKFNRAIVETESGATVPNGFLEFFSQRNGSPVNVYSDEDGQNSLGSEVQADNNGLVSVFLYPGVYRIDAKDAGGNLIISYSHEPIFNLQAASTSGLSLRRVNHTVGNFKLFQEEQPSGLAVEMYALNPNDLSDNWLPSEQNPIQIAFQKEGYSVTLHLDSSVKTTLPNSEDLGLGANGQITLYVYIVFAAPNNEQDSGDWVVAVTTHTQFDESYPYTALDLGSTPWDPDALNGLNGGGVTGQVRLLGKLEVERFSGIWRPNTAVPVNERTVGYTGMQTEITMKGRELLFQENATDMKTVLNFSALGQSISEIPDIPGTRFLRLNGDETVSARTVAQFRDTDLEAAGVNITNTFSQTQTFSQDVIVEGDLFVQGDLTEVDSEFVTTDTVVLFNAGEPGPGVTAGFSGIEIDRGSSTNYQFGFQESNDTFRIGEIGDLQAVATRNDSMTNGYVAVWNSSANRLDSTNTLGFELHVQNSGYDQLSLKRGAGAEWSFALSTFDQEFDITRNDIVALSFDADRGVIVGGAVGGSQGPATLNASGLYVSGNAVWHAGNMEHYNQFGLGIQSAPNSSTFDSTITSGSYSFAGADPSAPFGSAGGSFYVSRHATPYVIQLALSAASASASGQIAKRRSEDNGQSWSGWTYAWDNHSLAQPMTLNGSQTVTGAKTFTDIIRSSRSTAQFLTSDSGFFDIDSTPDAGNTAQFRYFRHTSGGNYVVAGYDGSSSTWFELNKNSGSIFGNPTDGFKGAGTINCKGIYKDGVEITGGGGSPTESTTTITPADSDWATQMEFIFKRYGNLVICRIFVAADAGEPWGQQNLSGAIPSGLEPVETTYVNVGQINAGSGDGDSVIQAIFASGGNILLEETAATFSAAYSTTVSWWIA